MNRFKEYAFSGVLSVFEIVVGILLLINPAGFTSGIIIAAGALLAALGAASSVRYFRTPPSQAAREQALARGLGLMLAGFFCMLRSDWFIATFPLLTLLYGVVMLMLSLLRIQHTVDALRMKNPGWIWLALSAAVSLALAVMILLNPFSSVNVLWMVAALSLIAEGVVDILSIVYAGKQRP